MQPFELPEFYLPYPARLNPHGAREYLARLAAFMPADLGTPLPEPANRTEKGLADLWFRTVPVMSGLAAPLRRDHPAAALGRRPGVVPGDRPVPRPSGHPLSGSARPRPGVGALP